MKRNGLNQALAITTADEAAKNLQQLGLNVERFRAEARARARAKAGGFSTAAEPLAIMEIAVEVLEGAKIEGNNVAKVLGEVMQKVVSEQLEQESEELVGLALVGG